MYEKALEILKIISNNNFEAYIVGGYARDKYLGINSQDIDICTNMPIEKLKQYFTINSEIKYGSFVINYKNCSFETTLFRKDIYSDSRFPKVEFVKNLKEDLIRRDFTINMLTIDKDGKYIDCVNCINDLDNKIIRCLTDSKIKLKEDPLRIIRAIRLSADLDFKIEDELKLNIVLIKEELKKISKNRINREFKKVKNKEKFYKLLNELDLIKVL